MRIDRLTLRFFRNYRDTTVTFPAAGAYITGANGSGKTNLLEAIYFLAAFTSFQTHADRQIVNFYEAKNNLGKSAEKECDGA